MADQKKKVSKVKITAECSDAVEVVVSSFLKGEKTEDIVLQNGESVERPVVWGETILKAREEPKPVAKKKEALTENAD